MNIAITTDIDFIVSCVTNPCNYGKLVDDYSPDPGLYFPPMHEGLMWVKVEDYGVFLLTKQSHIMYEVHTVLLPHTRGKAVEIGKNALKWAFANTDAKRIITAVPSYNQLALRLAHKVGFKEYGINPASFQKDGVLYSQTLLGISKEESWQ